MAWDFTHSCHQEPQRNFGWLNVFIMSVWKRDQLKNSKMAVMVHRVREKERSVRSVHGQLQRLTRRLCSRVCSWASSTELCALYPLCPLIAVHWPAALHCLNLADNWNRDTGCLPRVPQCCYTMPSNIPCGVDEEKETERTQVSLRFVSLIIWVWTWASGLIYKTVLCMLQEIAVFIQKKTGSVEWLLDYNRFFLKRKKRKDFVQYFLLLVVPHTCLWLTTASPVAFQGCRLRSAWVRLCCSDAEREKNERVGQIYVMSLQQKNTGAAYKPAAAASWLHSHLASLGFFCTSFAFWFWCFDWNNYLVKLKLSL